MNAIDALELDVTGDTANLDTGVTLKTLVDLSNALAALQTTASGAEGEVSALQTAVGAPASTDGEGNPVPAPVLEPGTRRVLRLMHFNDMHNATPC